MGQSRLGTPDLNEILIFARVVQTGSFVAAARELEMPKSTVSRKVAELEARLGARLLHRTTRKLSVTEEGQAFALHAARVVAEAEEATLAVGRMQETPRGTLRVTSPLNFGFLGPIVVRFLERYPEVDVELACTDRVVNLIEEGFDLAIRVGQLPDSSLISRPLGALRSYVAASSNFLEKHGTPGEPSDLEQLDCVVFGAGVNPKTWRLSRGSASVAVEVRARLMVNDFDFVDEAVLAGLGVGMLPAFRGIQYLRGHRLEQVLADWSSPSIPIHAVYPSSRHLSPKVKALLDHLREQLTPPPWERGPLP